MSSISPSVLKSLSNLVQQKLNYVCLVEYQNSQWYLALGRSRFFFIQTDLT